MSGAIAESDRQSCFGTQIVVNTVFADAQGSFADTDLTAQVVTFA